MKPQLVAPVPRQGTKRPSLEQFVTPTKKTLKEERRVSVVDDDTPGPPSVEQRQVDCLIDNCDGTNLKKFMLHVSKLHRDVPMERIAARSCADGRILRAESLISSALKCCRCDYKCFSAKNDNSAVMKLKVHWEKEHSHVAQAQVD